MTPLVRGGRSWCHAPAAGVRQRLPPAKSHHAAPTLRNQCELDRIDGRHHQARTRDSYHPGRSDCRCPSGAGAGPARRWASVEAHAAATYVVLNCSQKPAVRPADFTSACSDNGFGVTNMHSTSWTRRLR